MSRCGCSNESVVVDDGHGVDVTESRDGNVIHYTPTVDGSVLTANGLSWNAQTRRFAVKLAGSASGLAFDGTGGLYVDSEGGGGGGVVPGASVRALAERVPQQNIVGGYLGAGYMIKPQSTKGSYTYGVQRGLDFMHVPVRMLRDGTPVVTPDEYMGVQNGHISDGGQPALVLNQDTHRWRIVPNDAGAWPLFGTTPPTNRPVRGWFGFLEPSENGLATLADVFDLVGRSSVLWIELMFPPIHRDEAGNPVWTYPDRSPTDQQVAAFLDRVRVLVQRYGLQQSVILSTSTPTVPSGNGPLDVLGGFYQASMICGPVFPATEDLDRYPPESWPQSWSWAAMATSIPAETTKTYVDAGVHCLYAVCHRHHQHPDLVVPSGAAGVLSGDPEYYAGALDDHPTSGGYVYRKTSSTWWFNTIDHGLLPPGDALTDVAAGKRAYYESGQGAFMQLGGDAAHPDGSTYYVLQGWLSPIPAPSDYRLSVLNTMIGGTGAAGQGMDTVVAVDTDMPYLGLATAKQGYIVESRVARNGTAQAQASVRLSTWDPQANSGAGGVVALYERDITVTDPYVALRVRLNTGRLEFCRMPVDDPDTGTPLWTYNTADDTVNPRAPELGKLYRGGYVFTGRQHPGAGTDPAVGVRWNRLDITPNAGG